MKEGAQVTPERILFAKYEGASGKSKAFVTL
jgi:hypothetical protein